MVQRKRMQSDQAVASLTSGEQDSLAQALATPSRHIQISHDQELSSQTLQSGPARQVETAPYYSGIQIPTAAEVWRFVVTYLRTHKTPYVHGGLVAKTASAVVFLICAFSLFLTIITGFKLIDPLFDIVLLVWSAVFFLMGRILEKQTDDTRGV